jgi:hypothetical protein
MVLERKGDEMNYINHHNSLSPGGRELERGKFTLTETLYLKTVIAQFIGRAPSVIARLTLISRSNPGRGS